MDHGALISINNYYRENQLVLPEPSSIESGSILSPVDLLTPFFKAVGELSAPSDPDTWKPANILVNNADVFASPATPNDYVKTLENANVVYGDVETEEGKTTAHEAIAQAVKQSTSSEVLPLLDGANFLEALNAPLKSPGSIRNLKARLPEDFVLNEKLEVVTNPSAKDRVKRRMPFSKSRNLPTTTGAASETVQSAVPTPNTFIIQGKLTVYCRDPTGGTGPTDGPAKCSDANTIRNVVSLALGEQLGSADGFSVTASSDTIPTGLLSLLGPQVEPLLAALEPQPIDGCPGWTTYSVIVVTINPGKTKALTDAWDAIEQDPTSLLVGLNTLDRSLHYCGADAKHTTRNTKGDWTLTDQLKNPRSLSPGLSILSNDQKSLANAVVPGSKHVVVATNFPAGATVEVRTPNVIVIV